MDAMRIADKVRNLKEFIKLKSAISEDIKASLLPYVEFLEEAEKTLLNNEDAPLELWEKLIYVLHDIPRDFVDEDLLWYARMKFKVLKMTPEMCEQIKLILKHAVKEGIVTTLPDDEALIEYKKRFYPDDDWTKARNAFNRAAEKLYEMGFFGMRKKKGTGRGGYDKYGTRKIVQWHLAPKWEKKNPLEVLEELCKNKEG